jgi:hypothetical protein
VIKSETIGTLAAALAKAQGDFPPVPKGKTAKAGAYSYDYADLADILAALQPALAANQLSVVQDASVEFINGAPVAEVCTTILHSSGEWLTTGAIRIQAADETAQKIGAVLTYARRYSYGAALCISPEADTDGATDHQVDSKPQFRPAPKATPAAAPARANGATPSGDVDLKFGRGKGKKLSEVNDDDVRWYMTAWERDLADPEKAKFHGYSKKNLEIAGSILASRGVTDHSDMGAEEASPFNH